MPQATLSLSELIVFPDGREYRRLGACDSCDRPGITPGQCCTYVMLPLARVLSDDELRWLHLHLNITTVPTSEGASVRINIPCSALNERGRCSLFGTPERPKMCGDIPEWPGHLEGLPHGPESCAYKFEEIT